MLMPYKMRRLSRSSRKKTLNWRIFSMSRVAKSTNSITRRHLMTLFFIRRKRRTKYATARFLSKNLHNSWKRWMRKQKIKQKNKRPKPRRDYLWWICHRSWKSSGKRWMSKQKIKQKNKRSNPRRTSAWSLFSVNTGKKILRPLNCKNTTRMNRKAVIVIVLGDEMKTIWIKALPLDLKKWPIFLLKTG